MDNKYYPVRRRLYLRRTIIADCICICAVPTNRSHGRGRTIVGIENFRPLQLPILTFQKATIKKTSFFGCFLIVGMP